MKNISLRFVPIVLVGLLSSVCNIEAVVVVAGAASSQHRDVTVINETAYPITIQGEHKKGTHATGNIKKGFSKKDIVRDTEVQKVTGATVLLPRARAVYTFNTDNEYKYVPKQKAPNGKIISLDARHGNSFKSHPTWPVVDKVQVVPHAVVAHPVPVEVVPVARPVEVDRVARPVERPIIRRPFVRPVARPIERPVVVRPVERVAPVQVVAPVRLTKSQKKAAKKAAKNPHLLVEPAPVVVY